MIPPPRAEPPSLRNAHHFAPHIYAHSRLQLVFLHTCCLISHPKRRLVAARRSSSSTFSAPQPRLIARSHALRAGRAPHACRGTSFINKTCLFQQRTYGGMYTCCRITEVYVYARAGHPACLLFNLVFLFQINRAGRGPRGAGLFYVAINTSLFSEYMFSAGRVY